MSASYDLEGLFGDEAAADERAMKLPPAVKPRPRIVALSDEIMLKLGRGTELAQITVSFRAYARSRVCLICAFFADDKPPRQRPGPIKGDLIAEPAAQFSGQL